MEYCPNYQTFQALNVMFGHTTEWCYWRILFRFNFYEMHTLLSGGTDKERAALLERDMGVFNRN